LKTSFRFVRAVWSGDDRSSSASGAGGISGDTGRVNVVRDGAGGAWGNVVDGGTDRGLPVFDLGLNSLRIRFILEM
jgi:hypothetical protein